MAQATLQSVLGLVADSSAVEARRKPRRHLQQKYEAQFHPAWHGAGLGNFWTAPGFLGSRSLVFGHGTPQVVCYVNKHCDLGAPTSLGKAQPFPTCASWRCFDRQPFTRSDAATLTFASNQQTSSDTGNSPDKVQPGTSSVSSLPSRNSRAAIRRRQSEKSEVISDFAEASPWTKQPQQQPAGNQPSLAQQDNQTLVSPSAVDRRSQAQDQRRTQGRGRKRAPQQRSSGRSRDAPTADINNHAAPSQSRQRNASQLPLQQQRQQQTASDLGPAGIENQDMLELGRLGKPFGVKGEISIIPMNDSSLEALTTPGIR